MVRPDACRDGHTMRQSGPNRVRPGTQFFTRAQRYDTGTAGAFIAPLIMIEAVFAASCIELVFKWAFENKKGAAAKKK